MQTIAIIGSGAISEAVVGFLAKSDRVEVAAAIIERGMESPAREIFGETVQIAYDVSDVVAELNLVVDCAGHPALRQHGEAVLSRGLDLLSVSSGALADAGLYDNLAAAARSGDSQLRVVSGAIGALDALSAGNVGALTEVRYRGRKPPRGWRGSPADAKLDLDTLTEETVHFSGNARDAALEYPRNANVAASVALAGIGFEDTQVELIADPNVERNVHEIVAEGDFGRYEFRIEGRSLPGNPRSSAITAMSVVRAILDPVTSIVI